MQKRIICTGLLLSTLMLSGCKSEFNEKSFLFGPQDRYAASRNGKMLTIPAPLSSSRISHNFVIPEGTHQASPVPPPPGSTLATGQSHQRSN